MTTRSTSLRRWLFGVSLPLVALTACGDDAEPGDTGGVATLAPAVDDTDDSAGSSEPSSGDADDDASELEAPTDRNAAFVLYDRCMATRGFPTDAAGAADGPSVAVSRSGPDGGSAGEGPTTRTVGPGGIEIAPEDVDRFRAADEACHGHLDNIADGDDFTPEQQAAMEDAILRVEQCMHDKGFEVHLSAGSGTDSGLTVNESEERDASRDQVAPADPAALDAASEECSKVFDEYPELADVPRP